VRLVEVLEEAADDIEDGIAFYNQQALGVGEYFAQSILADLERLRFLNGIHSKHFGFFRMLAGRFPFGIYYRDTDKSTEVFAILDLRKDPSWIRNELTGRTA
jgi:hypothetical protein